MIRKVTLFGEEVPNQLPQAIGKHNSAYIALPCVDLGPPIAIAPCDPVRPAQHTVYFKTIRVKGWMIAVPDYFCKGFDPITLRLPIPIIARNTLLVNGRSSYECEVSTSFIFLVTVRMKRPSCELNFVPCVCFRCTQKEKRDAGTLLLFIRMFSFAAEPINLAIKENVILAAFLSPPVAARMLNNFPRRDEMKCGDVTGRTSMQGGSSNL